MTYLRSAFTSKGSAKADSGATSKARAGGLDVGGGADIVLNTGALEATAIATSSCVVAIKPVLIMMPNRLELLRNF